MILLNKIGAAGEDRTHYPVLTKAGLPIIGSKGWPRFPGIVPAMPHPPLRTFWCVSYMLQGKVIAEVQVEANTEAQALAAIETKGLVSPHKRHLADEVKVEKMG